jgi:transcriptional regulator with XRE-family HTH domain
MEPGLKLKAVREKLGLRFREVEKASNLIAQRHRSPDFAIGLSRLADIENKAVVPNIHRLYSLCAIYRLDMKEVLGWFGIELDQIWRDAAHLAPSQTHLMGIEPSDKGSVSLPLMLDPGVDFSKTTFLSRTIRQWGKVPLSLLDSLDLDQHLYGFIGWTDYHMYPLARPGALVQVDDGRNDIEEGGWTHEFERPIYFLELRDGYACSWCSLAGDQIILQPHPASGLAAKVLNKHDVTVVGQVVGVAMQLEVRTTETIKKTRRVRSATTLG